MHRLGLVLVVIARTSHSSASDRPNVLFIMVEDLRTNPWYDRLEEATPNIARLARRGVVFDKAYAQVGVCAPSRASLLTGLRPDTLGIFDFSHYGGIRYFRTIPSHFHRAGYQTASSGKLHHWDSYRYYSSDFWGHPQWEEVARSEEKWQNASVSPDAVHNDPLSFFRDSFIARAAVKSIAKMERLRVSSGEPWFQGVGFKGTHMPYHMPKRFFDRWADVAMDIDHAALSFPDDAPLLAHVRRTEQTNIAFRGAGREKDLYQSNGRRSTVSRRGFLELLRGYLACLSYTDFLLGQVLDALDDGGLWDSTVVVFTSDHGMHVGEKGVWGKWTLFEESTNVPLIIAAPSLPPSTHGTRSSQLVELVDIFPTLLDLTGTTALFLSRCPVLAPLLDESRSDGAVYKIPKGGPRSSVPGEGTVRNTEGHVFRHVYCDPLDGASLASLLKAPVELGGSWRARLLPFALSQKMTCKLPGKTTSPQVGRADLDPNTPSWTDFCPNRRLPRNPSSGAMGYALRSSTDFKYVAWLELDTNTLLPRLDSSPLAEQLYSLRASPSSTASYLRGVETELVNLSGQANHSDIQASLRRQLYDFLFFNASFAHLYHRRLDDRAKNKAIVQDRNAPPPRNKYKGHFYQVSV